MFGMKRRSFALVGFCCAFVLQVERRRSSQSNMRDLVLGDDDIIRVSPSTSSPSYVKHYIKPPFYNGQVSGRISLKAQLLRAKWESKKPKLEQLPPQPGIQASISKVKRKELDPYLYEPQKRLRDGTLTYISGSPLGLDVLHASFEDMLNWRLVADLVEPCQSDNVTPVLTPSSSMEALDLHNRKSTFISSWDHVRQHLHLYLPHIGRTKLEDDDLVNQAMSQIETVTLLYPGGHIEV
jgi:hypothetical protein